MLHPTSILPVGRLPWHADTSAWLLFMSSELLDEGEQCYPHLKLHLCSACVGLSDILVGCNVKCSHSTKMLEPQTPLCQINAVRIAMYRKCKTKPAGSCARLVKSQLVLTWMEIAQMTGPYGRIYGWAISITADGG